MTAPNLIDVLGPLAHAGYLHEADPCVPLCRASFSDIGLNEALVNLRHGRLRRTRLAFAAQRGWVDRITWLCSRGADPNALSCIAPASQPSRPLRRDPQCATSSVFSSPLSIAAQCGQWEAVRELLACGADLWTKDSDGSTALVSACRAGHAEIAQELLTRAAGGGPSNRGTEAGAGAGRAVSPSPLRPHGVAYPDVPDARGWTAVMYASVQGHSALVRVLVESGASVSVRDPFGWTAVCAAAARGHLDVVKELRRWDPDGTKSLRGMNEGGPAAPRAGAGSHGAGDGGGEGGGRRDEGSGVVALSPLVCASQMGHEDVLRELLDWMPREMNTRRPSDGATPLIVAAEGGHAECVVALMDAGARIDDVDRRGLCAWAAAAGKGHTAVASELRVRGARTTGRGRGRV
jgi:ankyrin repeat protein